MAKAISSKVATISASQVKTFLQKHPNFLIQHPELLNQLQIPGEWNETHSKNPPDIVDFRAALITHLQKMLTMRNAENHHFISVTRMNSDYQKRIHALILQMMRTPSLQKLLTMLADDMPQQLDLEKIVLCIVPNHDNISDLQKICFEHLRIVDAAFLTPFQQETVLFRSHIEAEPSIYGTTKIHSDILIALNFKNCRGFLAFGSRIPEKFDDGQSADLMLFLTHVFEALLKLHL